MLARFEALLMGNGTQRDTSAAIDGLQQLSDALRAMLPHTPQRRARLPQPLGDASRTPVPPPPVLEQRDDNAAGFEPADGEHDETPDGGNAGEDPSHAGGDYEDPFDAAVGGQAPVPAGDGLDLEGDSQAAYAEQPAHTASAAAENPSEHIDGGSTAAAVNEPAGASSGAKGLRAQRQQGGRRPVEPPQRQAQTDAAVAAASRASFMLTALATSGLLGPQLPHSPAQELGQLHRCARAGLLECQLALADRYLLMRGVAHGSCRRGVWYLKKAAALVAADVEREGNYGLPPASVHLRERWADAAAGVQVLPWDEADEVLEMEEDAALRGDAHAQRRLGYRRLMGRGLPADLAAAYRDFEAAAQGGDAYALFNLGYMHLHGLHVPPDPVAAHAYFLRAAQQGLAAGYNGLGVLAFSGRGGPRNMSAAREHFEKGAAMGNADSMFNLGTLQLRGLGFKRRDARRALDWYERSYRAGHWRAPYAMALVHDTGKYGVQYDCSKVERLLWQFVAERVSWTPALRAALRDVDAGLHWQALVQYLLLAEQGCEVAVSNAAFMLQHGMGASGPAALRLASHLLLRSAELNSTTSMVELATLLLEQRWLYAEQLQVQRPQRAKQLRGAQQQQHAGPQGQQDHEGPGALAVRGGVVEAMQEAGQGGADVGPGGGGGGALHGSRHAASGGGSSSSSGGSAVGGASSGGASRRRRAPPVFLFRLPPPLPPAADAGNSSSADQGSGGAGSGGSASGSQPPADGGVPLAEGGRGERTASTAAEGGSAAATPSEPWGTAASAPQGPEALLPSTPEAAAIAWLRHAAALGDSEATFNLAWMQLRGQGMARDPAAAAAALRAAMYDEPDSARVMVLELSLWLLRLEGLVEWLVGRAAADALVAQVLALRDEIAWDPAAAHGTPGGGGDGAVDAALGMPRSDGGKAEGAGGVARALPPARQGTPVLQAVRALRVRLHVLASKVYRALDLDKVEPDSVLLTLLLGALAGVLWLRQRQRPPQPPRHVQAGGRAGAAARGALVGAAREVQAGLAGTSSEPEHIGGAAAPGSAAATAAAGQAVAGAAPERSSTIVPASPGVAAAAARGSTSDSGSPGGSSGTGSDGIGGGGSDGGGSNHAGGVAARGQEVPLP